MTLLHPHIATVVCGVLCTCQRTAEALRELLDWQRHGVRTCCRIQGFLDKKKMARISDFQR
jgi:hypothetical protein